MASTHFTIEATIKGETRTVAVVTHDFWKNARADSVDGVGAYRKRGGKIWEDRLTFWLQADGSWKLGQNATFLNRSGYQLVGWADAQVGSRSEHNSSRA